MRDWIRTNSFYITLAIWGAVVLALLIIAVRVFASSTAQIDDQFCGSGWDAKTENGPPWSISAPDGCTITKVAVKAGTGCFITGSDGPFGSGCYEVSGVGTGHVTVKRIGDGPDCKEISHILAKWSCEQASSPTSTQVPPTNTPTTTNIPPTPTSTAVHTDTPESTATVTETLLPTQTPFDLDTPTPTFTPTEGPSLTPTNTLDPTPTTTPTEPPISTKTATPNPPRSGLYGSTGIKIGNDADGWISIPAINLHIPYKDYVFGADGSLPIPDDGLALNGNLYVGHVDMGDEVFKDLGLLGIGDLVRIDGAYWRVGSGKVIEPEDWRQYAGLGRPVLITCHPYGVDSHLLVIVLEKQSTE